MAGVNTMYRSILRFILALLILPALVPLPVQARTRQLPTLQQAKLLASDKADSDGLGGSVALSSDGNTALISAAAKSGSGAVYVFVRNNSAWVQQAKLTAADSAFDDRFGISVALSSDGNTAVIGAGYKDNYIGAAYIFTRSGSIWTQQAKLLAPDGAVSSFFGKSVALSSDAGTILIGASGTSDGGTTANGAVYVFTRNSITWTQQAKLLAGDKTNEDFFGYSVALSSDGSIALIGAHGKSDSGTTANGAAYVFTRNGTTWTQQAKLLASDKATLDWFGLSVALSNDGSRALIGASIKNNGNTVGNGAAYVFTRDGTAWTQQAKLFAADSAQHDNFGNFVALSGDGSAALIGAPYTSDLGTTRNGAVYVFTSNSMTWTQRAKLLANDKANHNFFGYSVALSRDGRTALTGATQSSDNGMNRNGAAYVFVEPPPTPTPTATTTATNTPLPPRPDTIGAFKNGMFYLRYTNTTGFADLTATFGAASDLPVVGDWNSDGVDTIGVYRGSTGVFFLSDSNTAPAVNYSLVFGNPGDQPFAGRWTADMNGRSGVGVYRDSNGILFQKKQLTTGFSDFFAIFGNPGDQPVAGDWDGNGFDSIGIYRPSVRTWYLSNNSEPGGITFSDVDFVYDANGALPIAGDWDGDGDSTAGILTNGGVFTLLNANASTGSYTIAVFGPTGSRPIAGKWTAASSPNPHGLINPITGEYRNGESGDAD
jgi:hypothetical protein